VKVQLFFSFYLTKKMNFCEKKNNRNFRFFIFSSFQHNERKSYDDVLSHVREFTVHREEEEEDRGGGVLHKRRG